MAMSSEQLIANEVLAFIQHAIDTMDEVSIIQICKTNFTQEEICGGKVLLYESLGKIDRMPSRRRDEKGERSLQDIISLLKETDPDDVPSYVAKNLYKLPPVTFDHVDVTRLLKDITTLKASLAEVVLKLEASQEVIGELRAEVADLRSNRPVCRSPEVDNINTRRGACNASTASFESAKLDTSPAAVPARVSGASRAARPAPPPAEVSTRVITSTPRRDYATAAARQPPAARTNKKMERDNGKSVVAPSRSAEPLGPKKSLADQDGFIKVERKKRKPLCRNQSGTAPTGPNHLLRPAVPISYVYVSRLHCTTKDTDVLEYLEKKTNDRGLRVEQLESRNKVEFNSFVVRVPTEQLSTFLKEDLWPKGVVFRKFRGRRRPPGYKPPAPHVAAPT